MMTTVYQRIDLLVGGPKHGEQYAVEHDRPNFDVAVMSYHAKDDPSPFVNYHYETYSKRKIAFRTSNDRTRVVEFFAHRDLSDERASERLWDYLLAPFGCRVVDVQREATLA